MLYEKLKSCERHHDAKVNNEISIPKFAKTRPTTALMLARRDITES
jgi:hypothetical protein